MDLKKIAKELKVPVESLTKYNKHLLDEYLANPSEKPKKPAK